MAGGAQRLQEERNFLDATHVEAGQGSYLSSQQGDFDPEKTLLEQLPPCLLPCLDSLVDWNYRSLRESLLLAQEILDATIQDDAPGECKPSLVRLWQSCILGGVQGLLYVIESSR